MKAGDPVLDLFSADLAAAKSDYEKSMAGWEHDRKELERAEKLRKTEPPAISERDYLSLVNDEKVSRTDAKVASDKLQVYGLTPAEIERVPEEAGTQKARITARATIDGVVVKRDAVQGNLTDPTDVLLVIAPLERLWVYGNVYPNDTTKVELGQRWVVRLLGTGREIPTMIDAISSDIDPVTRTLKIRGEIPNPDRSIKAGSLVGGYVEIPAGAGETVLPRQAMISTDGHDYVFVLRSPKALASASTGALPAVTGEGEEPFVFQRRPIRVAREYHDRVVVNKSERAGEGIEPGEIVASRGALVLSQLYEDASATRQFVAPAGAAAGGSEAGGDLTAPEAGVTIR